MSVKLYFNPVVRVWSSPVGVVLQALSLGCLAWWSLPWSSEPSHEILTVWVGVLVAGAADMAICTISIQVRNGRRRRALYAKYTKALTQRDYAGVVEALTALGGDIDLAARGHLALARARLAEEEAGQRSPRAGSEGRE